MKTFIYESTDNNDDFVACDVGVFSRCDLKLFSKNTSDGEEAASMPLARLNIRICDCYFK